MNKWNNYFEIAWKNLVRQKSRTILTIIALSIGMALLIIMLGAGQSLRNLVLSQLEIYNPNSITVEVKIPGKRSVSSLAAMVGGDSITSFKNKDVEAIAKLPNVKSIFSYVISQQVFQYQDNQQLAMVYGYSASAADMQKIEFDSGRFYTEDEEDSLAQVTVLGSKLKDDLFGEQDPIGESVYVGGIRFKVIGVLKKQGGSIENIDLMAYIPVKTLQKKILGTDYVMGALVEVDDPSKIDMVKDDIIYLMEERHNISDPSKDDFQVTTMAEAKAIIDTVLNSINLLLIALTLISLIVGGVGITNIMYVSVIERTFEIGLRRAVGAKKQDILWQFLIESIILTFIGGVCGIILGIGVSYLIYYIAVIFNIKWTYAVSLPSVLFSLIFSSGLGLIFGVYPARQAAELDPIAALRQE
jgi:ABC-type antimicrobial peptide transport system permease subunit